MEREKSSGLLAGLLGGLLVAYRFNKPAKMAYWLIHFFE